VRTVIERWFAEGLESSALKDAKKLLHHVKLS